MLTDRTEWIDVCKGIGDVIITMDDDLQIPPEEVPKLIHGIAEGYDLVIGAYDLKNRMIHPVTMRRGGMPS